ncbi:MAG: hypothetical protein NHF85_00565 [Candidatus Shikimatogenerans sp. JK-2022]|nr:hypothetical protein [Candidatus Shikimatogenerans bostrichidophilus]
MNKIKFMYTLKQKKYSSLINNFFNKLFIKENKFKNILITVIHVYINKIFNLANIYITVYPDIYKNKILYILNIYKNKKKYKQKLSFFLKNKFKIPNLYFYLYNEKILEFLLLNKIK